MNMKGFSMKKNIQIRHSLLLLFASLIWGTAFVAQSAGGDVTGPYTFNCVRAFIGSLALLPVILFRDKKGTSSKRPVTKEDKKTLALAGILCGVVLCLATNLQQLGLYYGTSAGKGGFLTACYILLVPILGIFLKKKCSLNIWIGVGLALVGLYFLCIKDSFSLQFSDLLVLLCALTFAIHILLVEHFAPLVDSIRLCSLQFFVTGVLSVFPMLFVEMQPFSGGLPGWIASLSTGAAWIPLLYAGVFSSGIAYTLQIIGQRGLNPTVASLMMSPESAFSALGGWLILHETLSTRELLGCLLIFVAILLAQVPVRAGKLTQQTVV